MHPACSPSHSDPSRRSSQSRWDLIVLLHRLLWIGTWHIIPVPGPVCTLVQSTLYGMCVLVHLGVFGYPHHPGGFLLVTWLAAPPPSGIPLPQPQGSHPLGLLPSLLCVSCLVVGLLWMIAAVLGHIFFPHSSQDYSSSYPSRSSRVCFSCQGGHACHQFNVPGWCPDLQILHAAVPLQTFLFTVLSRRIVERNIYLQT